MPLRILEAGYVAWKELDGVKGVWLIQLEKRIVESEVDIERSRFEFELS